MKKILITGAGGFIGSFLVEKALEEGFITWAGIRSTSNKEYLRDAKISFIDLNFSDPLTLKEQIRQHAALHGKWDYIIHNAGVTKCLDVSDFEKVNYLFTKHFVEALQETNVVPEKFIMISSLSAEYPDTFYGKSKRKAELFLEQQNNFPSIILRPTGVYGPRDKDYFLLLKTIKNGLDLTAGFTVQKLTFIYVKDLAKAAFLALKSPFTNKMYAISDGDVHTDEEYTQIVKDVLCKKRVIKIRIPLFILKIMSTIAELISRITKKPSTLNRDKYKIMKRRDWTCNVLPLEHDLGFRADYDLRKGIRESVEWYLAAKWI